MRLGRLVLSDCDLKVTSDVPSGCWSFAGSFICERHHRSFRLGGPNGRHGWAILSAIGMSVANVGGQKGSWKLEVVMQDR
jgi:hypothetical protein